jgi:AcrR family transcriptional regulator
MLSGVHRSEQSDEVRARLLAAGAELLSEGSPVSISDVAEPAGATKDAVQHHFGTREQLLLAYYEDLLAEFEGVLMNEKAHTSAAQRYVSAAGYLGPRGVATNAG